MVTRAPGENRADCWLGSTKNGVIWTESSPNVCSTALRTLVEVRPASSRAELEATRLCSAASGVRSARNSASWVDSVSPSSSARMSTWGSGGSDDRSHSNCAGMPLARSVTWYVCPGARTRVSASTSKYGSIFEGFGKSTVPRETT